MLIGLFGGTFNPIHNGHLNLANELLKKINFDEIQFVVSAHPPHRQDVGVSAEDRIHMVELAICHSPRFSINTIELNNLTLSYSIHTLAQLRSQYPQDSLAFIMSSDVFNHFNEWYRWQDILTYCHLIIANRPEHPLSQISWMKNLLIAHQIDDGHALKNYKSGKILLTHIPEIAISASTIREQLKNNKTPDFLPKEVLAYIMQHHLYKN